MELFKPLAHYVATYEPGTVSYDLLQSEKDPLRIYLVERYIDKVAYLEVHKKSKEFISFRAKLQKMQDDKLVYLEGDSFIESNVGFI